MKFGEGKDRLIAAVTRSLGSRSSTIGTAYSHAPHRRSLFSGAPDAEFVDAPCERTRFADRYLAVSKSPAARCDWRLWSHAIVHQIYLHVFRHIKQLSEANDSNAAQ
jgi:hypothetical protein